jgi:TctA family transporter
MKYVIGLFISTVGFYLASKHLNQDIREYWDFVAFFVVVLGTFAVMLITFPAVPASFLIRRFSQKFFLSSHSLKKHAEICLSYVTERKTHKNQSIDLNC